MRWRLLLGPLMILLLVALALGDEALERAGWRPGTAMLVVMLGLTPLLARELAAICGAAGLPARAWVLWLASSAGLLLCWWDGADAAAWATGVAGTLVLALAAHAWHRSTRGAGGAAGAALLAFAYFGVMFGFHLLLRQEVSAWFVLALVLTTKACDIGAYFTGTAIGRHKLIVWLSPGKTWEGLAGGLLTSALVAGVAGWGLRRTGVALPADAGPLACAGAGLILGLTSQGGDLLASLLKRDAGIKDSGHIIPGFGGLIDVVDSPIMTAPVAWWLVHLAGGAIAR